MPDCWSDRDVDACFDAYGEGETVAAWCQKFMTDDAYADRLMGELDECAGEAGALPKWVVPAAIGAGVLAVGVWFFARRKKAAA